MESTANLSLASLFKFIPLILQQVETNYFFLAFKHVAIFLRLLVHASVSQFGVIGHASLFN